MLGVVAMADHLAREKKKKITQYHSLHCTWNMHPILQLLQGLKYCVNCEEVENVKAYPSNSPVQQYSKPTEVPVHS